MTDNIYADPEGYPTNLPPKPVRYRIRKVLAPNGGASEYPVEYKMTTAPAGLAFMLGDVEEHQTVPAWDGNRGRYYHALAPDDQLYADHIVVLIQHACNYFIDPALRPVGAAPLMGVPDVVISDDEVIRRIERLDKGENTREAERAAFAPGHADDGRYPLVDLPFGQQRALIEQVEAWKQLFAFEILGEVE